MSYHSDLDLIRQEMADEPSPADHLDMILHDIEGAARELLSVSQTPEGLDRMLANDSRWFGALLALGLVGNRLTRHLKREPLRAVG